MVQVVADTWSRGRVGLVGDAAHCASPYSGMGVSAALVGAYVLADELHRHPDDPVTALRDYEATLRPFVDRVQSTVKPRLLAIGTPGTRAGVETLLAVAGLAGALRVPDLVARLASHDRGGAWQLPESSLLHRDAAGGAARPETRAGT